MKSFILLIILCFSTAFSYSQEEFPVLDLQEFLCQDPQMQSEFVDQFGQALNTYGFVLILNHGISNEKIDAAYSSSKDFFDLSIDQKQHYQNVQLNRGYRSYEPDRQDKKSDLQEYWHVGADLSLKRSNSLGFTVIPKNVWPKDVPMFKKKLTALYREISRKSKPLLKACSIYMGKNPNFLTELTQYGDSVMRVIHYLPHENMDSQWKAPHRDPNLLTIIVGASMEGLELQLKDGNWV